VGLRSRSAYDANGNVTAWGLDGEGRMTSKTYADTTSNTYTYEPNTSRLHNMADPKGNVTTYAYNPDNTLVSADYSVVAVGTGVASGPPQRSERAGLPHSALALSPKVETRGGPGMQDFVPG
jgi:YD repeat-containing protein